MDQKFAAITKTTLHLLQVQVDGQAQRALQMTHHYKVAGSTEVGATRPIVLSLPAAENFVKELQQALQMARTMTVPPKRAQ